MPLAESDKEKNCFLCTQKRKIQIQCYSIRVIKRGCVVSENDQYLFSWATPSQILAYMDDIVLFSESFEQHLQYSQSVFEHLRQSDISYKATKCVFASDKVDFLGYKLSHMGIKPQKRLTEAITSFHCPESKHEVKQFLGLAGFYRHIIQDFADISHPLNKLTGEGVHFNWDSNCQQAIDLLKMRLASEPVLVFPCLGEPFMVDIDASDYAAGGVLIQKSSDRNLHPVAYYSTAFNKAQQNYAPTTAEAFALVFAVRHWYIYLAGTTFVLNSDHNPLVYLQAQKDPHGKFG